MASPSNSLVPSARRSAPWFDVRAGEGQLAIALARQSDLHIYAVEADPKKAAIARMKLDAQGLYGTRVTVHSVDPTKTPYPKYFANLVVSSASLAGVKDQAITKEARRLQRPFGGMICTGALGKMQVETRGELVGAGSWTHQNSNPAHKASQTRAPVPLVRQRAGRLSAY